MRESPTGSGLLFVVVAALLIAPTLFVAGLLTMAGPLTRAALAGEDPAAVDEVADRDGALRPLGASAADGSDPPAQAPLGAVEVEGSAEAAGELAPIFEPRVGRFRLNEADPGEGGDGQARDGEAHDSEGPDGAGHAHAG